MQKVQEKENYIARATYATEKELVKIPASYTNAFSV